ncbi:NAD-dependent protein deacylase [Propionibacterium freudenreichii]|uniref:NAD-dependent protein deacetylase n=3 Tax=Propionibacterium freudenreichii TaxID=1744 RepID=D7GHU0_PROFC|nr:NAD-dependent protein deacylase [Propionibacterium freudenreichii]MDN5984264.1 NAD-dependent protein deacylase [Propionibacterium sp.]ARO12885.1 NAD-dependent protein deacylase [Propionibacterium freudenreichii]AWY96658.1 Transcriptional regulator, Sir2 family [Propionibacterium freudenreichii]MCQ1997636.1 NAD-dependent protein deacylase [Propionibacterium freudenreichii]MCT2973020.1 NAD-dependent protein deacylase [Propionibacterium freudenreichii]
MSADQLSRILAPADHVVFFGGAGVSTESGIPDFRSATGLYKTQSGGEFPPEYMLSHSCWADHPEDFYAFYRKNMLHPEAKPNAAHYALARLEKAGRLTAVVTQNIDGLHQMAGSQKVFELHGSVLRNHCVDCHRSYPVEAIEQSTGIPRCTVCNGIIKPDVVLYEEGLDPDVMDGATRAIMAADVLIVGGTSLNVYPAAGLLEYYRGDKLVLINKSATPADNRAQLVIHDSIGKVLGQAVDEVLGDKA